MLAYNKTTLYHRYVQAQALDALEAKLISADEYKSIVEGHPSNLYTPNLFVRIGMGFLTVFIVIFVVGLLGLIINFSYTFFAGYTMLCGLLCYGGLEYIVKSNRHYNSGVDNILAIASAVLVLAGIGNMLSSDGPFFQILISLYASVIGAWLAFRFISTLMGIVSFGALLCFIFFIYTRTGELSQVTFPFILIAASSIVYYITLRIANKNDMVYHRSVIEAINVVSIISIYACGNFYLVSEVITQNFNLAMPLYMVWFCWSWTFAIPLACLVAGLINKNIMMTRIGVVLVPVSLLTFRHYHAIMSAEAAMTIAGVALIIVSSLLIRYLRQARYGYTFEVHKPQGDLKNLEGFIIGEAFGSKTTPEQGTKFGGGGFGGAGAGGKY